MITSTPCLIWARVTCRTWSGPSAILKSRSLGNIDVRTCGAKRFKSPWPPVMEMPGPLATMRGPTRKPSLIESRRVDGQKRPRTDVAYRREASFERRSGVLHGGKGAVVGRIFELVNVVEPVGPAAQVRVAIDQSGQDRGRGKVDHRCAAGIETDASGSTALMRSPSIVITTFVWYLSPVPSKSRPAFTYTVGGGAACGHWVGANAKCCQGQQS